MAGTARELFEHQLREVYDAEHWLVDALSDMAARATDATTRSKQRVLVSPSKERVAIARKYR
ncbi:MAG TPA: DUF892 family protein [Actinomycetota bacterium]|nr:DUF892 family protein [Actinomycetota bacterium]